MNKRSCFKGIILVLLALLIQNCASTNEATIPRGWTYNLNWENYNSAEVTQSDYLIVQSKEDMVLLDGNDGRIVVDDIRERGGLFSEIGRDFKEQVKEDLLVSQRVNIKYFHKELPQLGTILLFNQVEKGDQVQSYDLKTGEEKWSSTSYVWNLDKYKDIANIAINEIMEGSLGAKGMSAVALQTRLIQSMIQEVPEKDAFLFRTVEKLYLINHETGEVLWENEAMAGTGIAAVNYLPQSNQLLIASSMSGLRDVLENANEQQELKQLILVDANTGDMEWKSEYQGRSEQVKNIAVKNKKIHLNFNGGSMEVFDYSSGKRIWGTRDGSLEGNTKVASFTGDYNLMETIETANPQFDGEHLYAVNPKDVKAVGLPDKRLQKFDYATGEILWDVELEKTTDIRDMLLRDDKVIVRLSSQLPDTMSGNVSNILGGVKDLGFYAFNKEDGTLDWQLSEPFENHVTNIVYGENKAWAGGEESLYKFSLDDGTILADSSYEGYEIGEIKYIHDSGDKLVLVGFKGMAIVEKENLTTLFSESPSGRLANYEINDRFLIVKMRRLLSGQENLYVYNLTGASSITNFTLTPPEKNVGGILGGKGYYPTEDFKQLITITEGGIESYEVY